MKSNKEKATDFLHLIVQRKIDQAYKTYVDIKGKHHNQYFVAGFPALKKGMEESHKKFPNTKISIKHVLEDGDLVATHSHVVHQQGQPGVSVVHLFRFKKGKIVELWDVGQQLIPNSQNKDSAF